MSDWEDPEAVQSFTVERSHQNKCPSCSREGPCKCPPILPGTGQHKPTEGEGNGADGAPPPPPTRRVNNGNDRDRRTRNLCYGCNQEGHIRRNCPNPDSEGDRKEGEAPKVPKPEYNPKEEDLEELFNMKLGVGSNFANYEKVKIEVTPSEEAPQPLLIFSDAPFSKELLHNIKNCGYQFPTPVQKHSIAIILKGKDLMSCAQTGSGKTAAFLLPTIHTLFKDTKVPSHDPTAAAPRALIIGPTRELIVQINNEARKFCHNLGLNSKCIYGGTSVGGCQNYLLRDRTDILASTPGRLIDMLDREVISLKNIQFVILDEADRMLEMGFRSDIENVLNHFTIPGNKDRQTLLFSATFPAEIQVMAGEYMKDYLFLKVGLVGGACEDIDQVIHRVKDYEKMNKLLAILNENDTQKDAKVVIFARKKKGVDFLASRLCLENHPATSIHGDRQQPQREEALRDFKRGVTPILVASEVAARGLDIPKVSVVINYDLPGDISTYVHRIGRSGRVGNKGKAISFYDDECDRGLAKELVEVLRNAKQDIPEWLEKQGDVYYGGGARGGARRTNRDVRDVRKKKDTEPKTEIFEAQEPLEEFWD